MTTLALIDARPFTSLVPETAARLHGCSPQPLAISDNMARRCGLGRQKSTVLEASGWRLPGLGYYHATTITGPRVEIVNAMIYPLDPAQLPVFATQVVLFGALVRIAFVDLQPLDPAAHWRTAMVRRLQQLREPVNAQLPLDREPPDWLAAHCSGGEFHVRLPNLDEHQAALIRDAWMSYVRVWANLAAAARPASAGEPAPVVRDYLHHHIAHSPGTTFLEKFFGPEWTRQYMETFMYGCDYDI